MRSEQEIRDIIEMIEDFSRVGGDIKKQHASASVVSALRWALGDYDVDHEVLEELRRYLAQKRATEAK